MMNVKMMVKNASVTFMVAVALLFARSATAQGEASSWIISSSQYYKVTSSGPVHQPDLPVNTFSGDPSISDSTGKLLFHFGTTSNSSYYYVIYDGNNNILPYCTSHYMDMLHWSNKMFLKNPSNPQQYYFFYSVSPYDGGDAFTTVRYSIIDMSLNGGNGDVTAYDIPLDSNVSLSYVPVQKQGDEFWLITNREKDKAFNAWLFSANGVATSPVVSTEGAGEPKRRSLFTGLKASPDGKMIAGRGVVYVGGLFPYIIRYYNVFDVNARTGVISYHVKIPDQAVQYDLDALFEFSPDSRLLYINWQYNSGLLQPCGFSGSDIHQYNLCYRDSTLIAQYSCSVKWQNIFCTEFGYYGSLQLAPDKKIYSPYGYIGAIQYPNHIGSSSRFVDQAPGFQYQPDGNKLLPGFYHYYLAKAVHNNIVYKGGCFGAPLQFSITNDTLSAAQWNFGDAASDGSNTSASLQPTHLFSAPGIYKVTADLYNSHGNLTETVSDSVEIKDPSKRLLTGLPKDTTICAGSNFLIGLPSVINSVYYWKFRSVYETEFRSYGTSDSLILGGDGDGTYVVEMHQNDCDGCIITDSIGFHVLRKPYVDLGAGRNLCSGDSLRLSVYSDEGEDVRWNTGADTSQIWIKQGGQYSVRAEYDHNGCVSRDTIDIAGVAGIHFSFGNDTTLCNNETLTLKPGVQPAYYLWSNYTTLDALTVTSPGTYWASLRNDNGCTASDTLQVAYVSAAAVSLGADTSLCKGESLILSVTVPSAAYLWNTGSKINTITVKQDGDYWVKVSNGTCTIADTVSVLFREPPKVFLGNDTTLCDKETLPLSVAVSNSTYTWEDSSIQNIHNITSAGTYWVQVNQQGCVARDTIRVNYQPLPVISLGNDTTLCEKQTLSLNESAAGIQSYRWQDGTTSSFYTIHTKGGYSLTVRGSNGCYNSDTVNVTYTELPAFNLGNDTTLCDRQTITLRVPASGLVSTWQDGSAATAYTVTVPGLYWAQLSDQGCSLRDSVLISYQALPLVSLGSDTSVCEGVPVMLNAFNAGSTYVWQDGSLASGYTVTKSGMYSVAVRLNGCVQKDTVVISYISKPVFSLGSDTTLCVGNQFVLQPLVSNAISYLWQDGSTLPQYVVHAPGTYRVSIANNCGVGGDEMVVKNGICRMSVPSAFTPNQDGHNDLFRVTYDGRLSHFHISVYNRWGKLMFTSSDIGKGWDGTCNGISLYTDTYIWTLSFIAEDGTAHQFHGTVVLLR